MEESLENNNSDSVDLYEMTTWIWSQRNFLTLFSSIAAVISVTVALILPNNYISNVTLMPKDTQLDVSLSGGGVGGFDFGGLSSLVTFGDSVDTDPNVILAKELLVSKAFVVDFIKKYDYLPELLHAKRWEDGSIVYKASGYNVDEDKLDYMPSDYDIYKAFLLRFSIETDRKTKYAKLGFEHVSPHFSQELLTNLVREVNDKVKDIEVGRAQRSIVYLDNIIAETSMRDLNLLLNKLKEKNLKILMLAEIDEFFILDIVDPAFLPTEKSKPYRALISVFGTFFGFLIGLFILGLFRLMRYEVILSLSPFRLGKNKLST
ncbi:hypothetical protein M9C83_01275 [SAR86 cluster bacterium]|nr:hypothetical protein M9C83_01275 [SAR86 cluster bacterium]